MGGNLGTLSGHRVFNATYSCAGAGMCQDPPSLVMEYCGRGSLLEVAVQGREVRAAFSAFSAAVGSLVGLNPEP